MIVRSISALAVSALLASTPALAQGAVTPGLVLAAKGGSKPAKGDHGFSDRTARISAIMGPELSGAAPSRVPTTPSWHRTVRREADAATGLR